MRKILSRLISVVCCLTTATVLAAADSTGPYERSFAVGTPSVHEVKSPNKALAVVFEDDGETGYFYALDLSAKDQPIQEALHIYDVGTFIAHQHPSHVRIAWSKDGMQAGLWIDDYPHAVVDFASKRGYCRTNFPRPGKWKSHDFTWSDDALRFFQ